MDADPPQSSPAAASFTAGWPPASDDFFGPDTESTILTEFGWNLHADHHQIEIAELGYHSTDFAGNYLPENTAQLQSPIDPAAVADPTTSKPSVSSCSSEDPSGGSAVKPAEIPNKIARKKGQKRIRQPRFAFMTKSNVEYLEDGYRWRKYGQKAVKNSPFPRSYFRCTNSKCTVKKRVERCWKEPDTVITTYEGQHCHHAAGFPRPSTSHFPIYPQIQPGSNDQGLIGHDIVLPTSRS